MVMSQAVAVAARRFGIDAIKPEQEDVINAFVGGRDTFECMPAGYGKSLCFALLPYVYDHLHGLIAVAFNCDLKTWQECEVLLIKLKQRPRTYM